MTELRQCKTYGEYLTAVAWGIEKRNGVQAFIRKIPFTTISVMKIQRASIKDLEWEWIKTISQNHKVLVNYIELQENIRKPVHETSTSLARLASSQAADDDGIKSLMRKQGYRAMKNGMLPTKTQVLDITKDLERLRKNLKEKTRYNLGLAQRKGLMTEIKTGTEMLEDKATQSLYLKIIRENAHRVGYWAVPNSWVEAKFKTFGKDSFVVFVKEAEHTLAVSLFLCTDTTCFYSLNGSTVLGRKVFAPTLTVWAGIEEAKRRKLVELDFDGVYDERFPNKRWLGYTRFKAGFGGDYLYYPPAFVKWLPLR